MPFGPWVRCLQRRLRSHNAKNFRRSAPQSSTALRQIFCQERAKAPAPHVLEDLGHLIHRDGGSASVADQTLDCFCNQSGFPLVLVHWRSQREQALDVLRVEHTSNGK